MQTARGEVEQLTKIHFIDDFKNPIESIYSNFSCTSYDISEDSKLELKKLLKKHKVKVSDLSPETLWFLDELEINL